MTPWAKAPRVLIERPEEVPLPLDRLRDRARGMSISPPLCSR